jgi:BioD-like phosphotransacetylase family protein
MLCAGLGKYWLDSGKKVGYLKLVTPEEKGKPAGADEDDAFIQRLFAERISGMLRSAVTSRSYDLAARDKDIVIVEGLLNASKHIESLNAKVVIIHDYATQLSASIAEGKKLASRLVGIVLNKVPRNKIGMMQNQSAVELIQADIKLLGIIPEDRTLMTLTVGELAEALQGKILNDSDKSSELVDNIMLGALAFDSGLPYFNRKNNKAVILKSDRADIQLAALQTSLRCMVLGGATPPMHTVAQQAAAKKSLLSPPAKTLRGWYLLSKRRLAGSGFARKGNYPG